MTVIGNMPSNAKVPVDDFPDDWRAPHDLLVQSGVTAGQSPGIHHPFTKNGGLGAVVSEASVQGAHVPVLVPPASEMQIGTPTVGLRLWATVYCNTIAPGGSFGLTVSLQQFTLTGAADQITMNIVAPTWPAGDYAYDIGLTPVASGLARNSIIKDYPPTGTYTLCVRYANAATAGSRMVVTAGLQVVPR